jgi:hypothetical protein
MRHVVIKDDGCWEWTRPSMSVRVGSSVTPVRRAIWALLRGELSPDVQLTAGPSCSSRKCIRPDHAEIVGGTVEDMQARIRARVSISETGCWEWQGALMANGYGVFHIPSEGINTAHRAAYRLWSGPIPAGLVVMHRCDNKRCCNVAHLVAATQSENILDSIAKGRFRPSPQVSA